MKRIFTFLMSVAVALTMNVTAQEVVITDADFEIGTDGAKVAKTYSDNGFEYFTTWSDQPGGAEDVVFSKEKVFEGSLAAKLAYGNDFIAKFEDKTAGHYTIDFMMFVPTGKDAYFNVLHNFAGGSSEWAVEIYVNSSNRTYYTVNSEQHDFTFTLDKWVAVSFDIDLDNDWMIFKIDGEVIGEWQYSLAASKGLRKLDAMDFYPPTSAAKSTFYIDNFVFKSVGAPTAPEMSVDVDKINVEVAQGQSDNVAVTVSNSGTSIGDYNAHLVYPVNEAKEEAVDVYLSYCGEVAVSVGFNTEEPLVIETGARYDFDYYSSFLGANVTQVSYFLPEDQSGSTYSQITLRVYGHGTNEVPGEVLAEKVIQNPILNYWNTATLDEPIVLDGGDIWVTCEIEQPAGAYPISFDGPDGEPYNANGDYYRTREGAWSNFANPTEYGNVCIRAFGEGNTVPAWTYLSGDVFAALKAGETGTINVMMDAAELTAGNTYNVQLVINTNDVNHPLFEIPVTLLCFDGINAIEEGNFAVYPNPASDKVRVEVAGTMNNVVLYDELGKVVRNINTNDSFLDMSLNDLASGIYFLRIDTNDGIKMVKLIVK